MKTFIACAAALALLPATAAIAQDAAAPAFKTGTMLKSADGKRIGRIDRVNMAGTQPTSVSIIYDSHVVHVPTATIAAGEGGALVTSLKAAEVRKLN